MANSTVSVSFANGFVGDYSKNNESTNASLTSTLGWSNLQFVQSTDNGQFGGTQGNDYTGTILVTDAHGVQHAIDGVINWRAPSGSVSTIVFYATGSSHTLATNSGTYVIDPFTEQNGDPHSFIGLTFNGQALTISGGKVTGNAATSGLLATLNTYFAEQPQISINDVAVNEGSGMATVTVTLSKTTTDTVTVNYATGNGTATAGTDYTAASGTLTFAPNETSKTFQVPILDNHLVDGTRSFNVTLTNSALAAITDNSGTVTISDNDVAQSVSTVLAEDAANTGANPVDSSVVEGNSLVYTVTMSMAAGSSNEYALSLAGSASVADYGALSFSDGVAWKNGDAATGIVVIPSGVSSFKVTVATVDDSAVESAESLVLTVGGVTATGTITDNDVPSISSVLAEDAANAGATPADSAVVEGASLQFAVTLSAAGVTATEFTLAHGGTAASDDLGAMSFSDGVAWKNGDASTGVIVVPAGVASFKVFVATVDDAMIESAESLMLTVGGVAATGTITDNDVQSVSAVLAEDAAHTGTAPTDSSVEEGASLQYSVSLNAAGVSAGEFTLSLGGTASGADYGALSFSDGVAWKNGDAGTGVIVVPAGVAGFKVTVATVDDAVIESAESLVLTVGGVAASGTITDNDSLSVTSVSAASSVIEGEGLLYSVALNAASVSATEFSLGVGGSASDADHGALVFSDGVAWKGGDPASGVIVVPANVSSFTISVATTDDAVVESAESLVLTVGGVAGTGTINDNDVAPPVVVEPPPAVVEPPPVVVEPPPVVVEPPPVVVEPPPVVVEAPPVVVEQPPVVVEPPPVVVETPPVIVVPPPVVVEPPVVPPVPPFGAALDPTTDDGKSNADAITSVIKPEFTVSGAGYFSLGGTARLTTTDGTVLSTTGISAEAMQTGKVNLATPALDDGEYTFISQVLDANGKVVAESPVKVTIVTDVDGVAPSIELAANGGDFNHDGIMDWQQHSVAQMPLASLADYALGKNAAQASFGAIMAGTPDAANPGAAVQLTAGAQLLDLSLTAAPAPLNANTLAASPMFNFSVKPEEGSEQLADMDAAIAGLQTRVVIDLAPGGVQANDFIKWDKVNQRWYSFLDDQRLDTFDSGATLVDSNGDGKVDRIVITLTDGGWGDEDGLANGVIVDPGMLAQNTATPVFSIVLANGDRCYTTSAQEAAALAKGTGNIFEGARFDALEAGQGGHQLNAFFQPYTKDWYYAAAGDSMPYSCYQLVSGAGFTAAAAGSGVGVDIHLFQNAMGQTQLLSQADAQALGLGSKGFKDLGAKFSTTNDSAFTFDAEGYLIANRGNASVQALVQSLAGSYHSTSDAGFVEAVEQNYLAQVSLVGLSHGGAATAADLNAVFGTAFGA